MSIGPDQECYFKDFKQIACCPYRIKEIYKI